jgi:hypothetical protein
MAPVQPTVGAKSENVLRRRVRPLWAGLGTQSRGSENLFGHDEVGHERVGREELTDLVLQLVALLTSPGYFGLHCLELRPDDLDGTPSRCFLSNGS